MGDELQNVAIEVDLRLHEAEVAVNKRIEALRQQYFSVSIYDVKLQPQVAHGNPYFAAVILFGHGGLRIAPADMALDAI